MSKAQEINSSKLWNLSPFSKKYRLNGINNYSNFVDTGMSEFCQGIANGERFLDDEVKNITQLIESIYIPEAMSHYPNPKALYEQCMNIYNLAIEADKLHSEVLTKNITPKSNKLKV